MAQEIRITGQSASESIRQGIGVINCETGKYENQKTMPDPGPGFPAPYATDPDVTGPIPLTQTDWNSIVQILVRNPQGSPYPDGRFKMIKSLIAGALKYQQGTV